MFLNNTNLYKNTKLIIIVLKTIILTSCAVGPDYETPNTEVSDEFTETRGSLGSAMPANEWWNSLNDDLLNQLIKQAIEENHDLRIAEQNFNAARALLSEQRLEFFPIVPAQGSITRQQASEDLVGSQSDRLNTFYDASLDANWELDFFGRIRRSVEALGAEYQSAAANWQDTQVIITAEVARSYMELRGAQYRLDVASRNAENQQQTYELTQALLEGGRGTDLDIARAQAQLESTLASIPPLETEVIRAMHRIGVLVGKQPTTLRTELSPVKDLPTLPENIEVGDPERLLRQRPDIRIAERDLAAATARIGIVTADLFPRISIIGSYGSTATSSSRFAESSTETFTLGPAFTWAAFDLGRVRARIRAADANAEAQLALYEKTVLLALEETENSFSNYTRANERQERLTIAAKASARAAELARLRYRNGADSFLTVLDAERRLLEAQDQLALSATQSGVAYVALYKALGVGWKK